MLKLRNVSKSYIYGKNQEKILDNINIDFKNHELVFILGKSGSGKTTLLNLIGGLDVVDEGNIYYDDEDICKFNDIKLDGYRNSSIGYIFQNYNLINNMTVLDNIKVCQTINRNKFRCDTILKQLNLYSKRKMMVNRLSGGEKQRVAIARALINDPDIILADEPTGALDSNNGMIVMDILKSVSIKKLVIVVSHDISLANKYADRIINIVDGKVDYLPICNDGSEFRKVECKKLHLFKLLKLAIKNIKLKFGKNLITSLAISLGVFGIMLVTCLSKSFNREIDNLEKKAVSVFPIVISNEKIIQSSTLTKSENKIVKRNEKIIRNIIDERLISYLNSLQEVKNINYVYDISMPFISDKYNLMSNKYFDIFPMIDNYEIIYGHDIENINEVLLKIDSNNNVSEEFLDYFRLENEINYDDIVGRKIKVILNDEYYRKENEFYYIENDYCKLYNQSNLELTIVGIIKEKEVIDDTEKIYYSSDLFEYISDKNMKSNIVYDQLNSDENILGLDLSREELLSYLSYNTFPKIINIYVDNLDNKSKLLEHLNDYNEKIIYFDTMNDAMSIIKNFIRIISIILYSFSAISLIVSMIMISILTSNRVVERIREIGILRSFGARKNDIMRIFNIENFIIGIIASLIALLFMKLLVTPINLILFKLLESENLFVIDFKIILFIIFGTAILILLSGTFPAYRASRMKIVQCLKER